RAPNAEVDRAAQRELAACRISRGKPRLRAALQLGGRIQAHSGVVREESEVGNLERPRLDRSIGLLQATAMVAGIIVGASIFVQPSEINRHVPSVLGVLAVWAAAGALTLFGSLVCAELSSIYPRTGGIYVFLKETLSPAWGFLWGWAMFWSAH